MSQNAYIFNQLCSLLPRDHFEYLVKKHNANYHVRSYTCWNHLMVMLWAQLTHRDSLRDIEAGLRAHGEKLYRLGMGKSVNKSTMSYANTNKEVAVFRELAQKMMELASRAAGVKNGELGKLAGVLELAGVFAVDSSTVNLDLKRFGWSVPQEGMGGIKLHTMYDVMREVPALCLVTGHEERDQTFMDDYPYMKGGLYVFDRAYVKTPSLKRIDDGGAYFIVRRKKGMEYRCLSNTGSECLPVYGDKRVEFTNRWARKGYPGQLRLVQYYSKERNEVMDFLTNNFQMSPMVVACAYKNRWSIELLFRWIKRHLIINRFYGTSANAVFTQVYVAITAYCLVAMAGAMYRFKGSAYELMSVLSVILFEKQDLSEVIRRYENHSEEKAQMPCWPTLFDTMDF